VIRTATRDDAEAFATVITAAQATWVSWAGAAFQPYDAGHLAEQWSSRLVDPATLAFVAGDEQGQVVAVAAAGPEAASFEPSDTSAGSAHLSTLFALPESHGSGVAQELHDRLLAALRHAGYRTVRLWVPEGAAQARRFYERNGWTLTGKTTVFAGLARVEMRRDVAAACRSRVIAWVIVDLQHAFACAETRQLAGAVHRAVEVQPGKAFALVQINPPTGPLRTLRGWTGASAPGDGELLAPLPELNPEVFAKTGYGAASPLPLTELGIYDTVYVAGADTDACVLATALALFDAGVRVVVREDLCWSAGGPLLHQAGLDILRRQLGRDRVVEGPIS
jgi:nicotinamidase-related amidase/GNAT superfamily N-acetyltransferase